MLTKFEVTNFKNFAKKITLDLTDTNQYAFNKECVKDGVVNKGLIYGHNATGKSNLGFAIFDLVSHLTDKYSNPRYYLNYLNAQNSSEQYDNAGTTKNKSYQNIASFNYKFNFATSQVEYAYGKIDNNTLVYEKLMINGNVFAEIDRRLDTVAKINVKGAENLKRDIGSSKISILSYIYNNTVLEDSVENSLFLSFLGYIDRMLFFRSLERNNYIGLDQVDGTISESIIENDNLKDFELFLNRAGIECELALIENSDTKVIAFNFNNKLIPFFDIASQGTKSLSLFYFWLQRLKKEGTVSFLFIDEFDAFYHHSLSALIINELKKINSQVFVTTHNTSIMTNELLRPDCYFLLKPSGIKSLASSTVKELREGHNIEKMYRAGSFNG